MLIAALVAAVGFFGYLGYGLVESSDGEATFSPEQTLLYAERQVEFGPRVTGTAASEATSEWLVEELGLLGWEVYIQPFQFALSGNEGEPMEARNIIAVRGEGPTALLATHYDTRLLADLDPDPERQSEPVPGANSGAAGAALLLELARTLDVPSTGHEVCLVFFDATQNADIPGWEGNLGSRHFVQQLPSLPRCTQPRFAVTVERIGAADLTIERDPTSSPALADAVWSVATELGFTQSFVDEASDPADGVHLAFAPTQIPTLAIMDNDYAHLRTVEDTVARLSLESLQRVGRVLEAWLEAGAPF